MPLALIIAILWIHRGGDGVNSLLVQADIFCGGKKSQQQMSMFMMWNRAELIIPKKNSLVGDHSVQMLSEWTFLEILLWSNTLFRNHAILKE